MRTDDLAELVAPSARKKRLRGEVRSVDREIGELVARLVEADPTVTKARLG